MNTESKATMQTRARYERLAPFYDRLATHTERRLQPAFVRLWAEVRGPTVLEVGVGTGRQIPFYPAGVHVTAIDLSPRMLERARQRASQLRIPVELCVGDIQALDFPDASFDEAVAVCAFYSVPEPFSGSRNWLVSSNRAAPFACSSTCGRASRSSPSSWTR